MERVLFNTLKQNKLFAKVDVDSLIVDDIKGNFLAINEGEILFREGEVVSSLFLVMWGEINVIRKRNDKIKTPDIHIKNNQVFYVFHLQTNIHYNINRCFCYCRQPRC